MADLNEDRLDRVHSLSKAALAIGAGAAFLYRGKGSDVLSKGLKRTSRALSEAYSNASEHSLRSINGHGKAFAKKALSDFSDSYKRNEGIKQSVRTDSCIHITCLNIYILHNPANYIIFYLKTFCCTLM